VCVCVTTQDTSAPVQQQGNASASNSNTSVGRDQHATVKNGGGPSASSSSSGHLDIGLSPDQQQVESSASISASVLHVSFYHWSLLLLLLVWQAPLRVRSAKRRHQSPEWTILSHSYRLIQGEIVKPQVLLDSLHPCSSRTSWWSPPVLHLTYYIIILYQRLNPLKQAVIYFR